MIRGAAVMLAAALLAGCRLVPVVTYDGSSTVPIDNTVLTPDGYDGYRFTSTSGRMHAAALDGNRTANLRTAFWPADSPWVADAQSCATWTEQQGDIVQQGAALRIRSSAWGTRALTVTKNIWYYGTWIFNFHTWDTTRSQPFEQFGSVTVEALRQPGGGVKPLPWHFCARTIGNRLEIKVWTSGEAEPAWGDPARGGGATIPHGWSEPGASGWYIGHLGPGGSAQFDGLKTWKYVYEEPEGPAPPDDDPDIEPTTRSVDSPATVDITAG